MNPLVSALLATATVSAATLTGTFSSAPSDTPTLTERRAAPSAHAMGWSDATGPSDAVSWPVSPANVQRGFEASAQYGPGHRGVDLLAWPGQRVVAALPGTVQFTGTVAGRPIIVVRHDGDLRTTYLPVRSLVKVGDQVGAGDRIGRVAAGPHCATVSCLHWGARRHDRYIDPLSLMSLRVVLLPVDG